MFSLAKTDARANFAAQHLLAAQHFCGQVAKIERDGDPSPERFALPHYIHCWSATVVFSVMALEANVYDLMTTADRGEGSVLGCRRFSFADHRRPLLNRYKLLHQVLVPNLTFDLSQGVRQEARALVSFRDELVHYKTEWRSVAQVSERLESLLQGRFTLNPFRCGAVFFPEQCVSGSSAEWAVRVAHSFMVEFANVTGCRLNVEAAT